MLAAEGLVELVPRRGCRVTELSEDDADALFPVMALLEGRCAFEAAQQGQATTTCAAAAACTTSWRSTPPRATSTATTAPTTPSTARCRRSPTTAGSTAPPTTCAASCACCAAASSSWPGRIDASINEHRVLIDGDRAARRGARRARDARPPDGAARRAEGAARRTNARPTTAGRAMLDELREAASALAHDRALRGLLTDCRRLLSERGEANSAAIARDLVEPLRRAARRTSAARFFEHLASDFSPDPQAVLQSAQAYAEQPERRQPDPPDPASPSRRARSCCGASTARPAAPRASSRCAARCCRGCRKQPELQALEADLLHLLSSWFNPGFLQMRRVDWNSPAQLLEQIIRHEAVHADRRLGRPAPAPAARPPLLRVLPSAAAGRAADLRRGGAAARDAGGDRAADRQDGDAAAARARSRSPRSIRSATASPACAACRSATS